MVEFCKENKLSRGRMSALHKGLIPGNKYKGYQMKLISNSETIRK